MMVRHFVSQNDLAPRDVRDIVSRAVELKDSRYSTDLLGRTLVMFFEKASTRTRLSFEIGMTQLGGHAIYLDRDSSQLSRGESVEDTARVISRYADLIMARVNAHQTVVSLAESATIPVINGLSDEEHPCQSMADLMTIIECKRRVDGMRIVYVGDGDNNVTHSLMIGVAQLGGHMVVTSPPSLRPRESFIQLSSQLARRSGGTVSVEADPEAAVRGADVVYTDVWVSMGRDATRERRAEVLSPYRVDGSLIARAKPDCLFMHCLPAHVGEEVSADVAYGPRSVIFQQAENRLHIQKAIMLYLTDSIPEDGE